MDFMEQMLKNKEETMQAMEGSLQFSRNRITELIQSLNNVQNDRDAKAKEILYLQKAIDIQTKTIDELKKDKIQYQTYQSTSEPVELFIQMFVTRRIFHQQKQKLLFINQIIGSIDNTYLQKLEKRNDIHEREIQKYMYEIQSLKFDLSVMEDLYKICNEEMLKQEEVINLLRQANLDNREEVLNLNVDNKILSSQLKKRNNECKNCKNVLSTVDGIKGELPDLTSKLNALKEVLIYSGCGQRVNNSTPTGQNSNRTRFEEELTYLNSKIETIQNLVSRMTNDAGNVVQKYTREVKQSNSKVCYLKNILGKKNILNIKLKRSIAIKMLNLSKLKQNIEKLTGYKRQNQTLLSETILLQHKMKNSENLLNESEKRNERLKLELEKLKESLNVSNKENEIKSEIITWLEIELAESSAKGLAMCKDVRRVFGTKTERHVKR